jgi:hypothetical protein
LDGGTSGAGGLFFLTLPAGRGRKSKGHAIRGGVFTREEYVKNYQIAGSGA